MLTIQVWFPSFLTPISSGVSTDSDPIAEEDVVIARPLLALCQFSIPSLTVPGMHQFWPSFRQKLRHRHMSITRR